MARTKLNQRSANRVDVPMGATGGRTPPPKWSVALLAISIITAIWAAAMLTPFGRIGYYYFFVYSEFYMGVLTLVSLSITIMIGLVATDRLVLSIRQRVLLQSAHRTTGVIAVASLVVHVWTKYMEQHIRAIDIVIPFLAPYNTVTVGMGTLSGWVMMLVMWTGIARSKFIGKGKPWMWRSIHAVSYLMWPIALVHGLAAGRAAATWVIVSYVVCVLAVLVGLAVRLSVSLNRKKDFSSTATGSMKPVGAVVPTQSAPIRKPSRRREPEPEPAAPAQWRPAGPRPPAGPAPVSGMPTSPMPTSAMPMSGMPMSGMPSSSMPISPSPYDEDRRGRRRYEEEDQRIAAPRQRRAMDDRYDEPTGPMSRRAIEDDRYDQPTGAMSRRAIEESRRYPDEDPPRGRGRRRAMGDEPRYDERPPQRYADEPRGRRYADEDPRYDDRPAPMPPMPGPRGRRYADEDVDRADSGRHSRSEFVDLAAPATDSWRVRADPNYMDPDETPTLVDMASRRARRQAQQEEPPRATGRGARRGGGRGRGSDEMLDDDQYWRQLRGEAQ